MYENQASAKRNQDQKRAYGLYAESLDSYVQYVWDLWRGGIRMGGKGEPRTPVRFRESLEIVIDHRCEDCGPQILPTRALLNGYRPIG